LKIDIGKIDVYPEGILIFFQGPSEYLALSLTLFKCNQIVIIVSKIKGSNRESSFQIGYQ